HPPRPTLFPYTTLFRSGRLKDFAPKAKIIHLEIDPAEIGKNVKPDATLRGDAKASLRELNKHVSHKPRERWFSWLDEMRGKHPSDRKSTRLNSSHQIIS